MKIKYKFAIQKVMDQYCAVAVGSDALKFNGMLRFTETGRIIFTHLQAGATEAEILAALKQEYKGDEQEMLDNIRMFAEKLRDAGILEED